VRERASTMSETAAPDDRDMSSSKEAEPRVLAVTRIHQGSSSKMASIDSVIKFVNNSSAYASAVLICIGIQNQKEQVEYIEKLSEAVIKEKYKIEIILLPITPWGQFTFALNCAIGKAVDGNFNVIAFQSLEFQISPMAVKSLLSYMNSINTLVVGPAMAGYIDMFYMYTPI
jgi:hypothetical protein